MIVGTGRGHFPISHSFLVKDEVSALIDTGCGLELLKEIDRTYDIDLIINSHCHPDHSAGNWIFESIPVHAPAMGANSHGRLGPLSMRFFPGKPFAGRWRDWITRTMGFQDKEPSEYFEDGHVFDFGHLRLQDVHTPGHNWPIYEKIDESVDKYSRVMDQRSEAILEMLEKGMTMSDMVKAAPIYGYHPYEPEILSSFESRMIDLHIEEMLESGLLPHKIWTLIANL